MLITLLFCEDLHKLNSWLYKLVTCSLNLLQNCVSVLCVCEYVEVLSVKYLAPDVVQTNRLVVVFGRQVEFDTIFVQEGVWNFITTKVL